MLRDFINSPTYLKRPSPVASTFQFVYRCVSSGFLMLPCFDLTSHLISLGLRIFSSFQICIWFAFKAFCIQKVVIVRPGTCGY